MLFDQEVGGGAAGQQAAQLVAVLHAAGVDVDDFRGWGCRWAVPKGPDCFTRAGNAVELGARIFPVAELLIPLDAVAQDAGHVAEGFPRC